MTYIQTLIDNFNDNTLNTSVWSAPDMTGIVEQNQRLTLEAFSNYASIRSSAVFDISTGILGIKFDSYGTATDSVEAYFGIHDGSGRVIEVLATPIDGHLEWLVVGDDALSFSNDVITDTTGLGPGWVADTWLGLGNFGADGVIGLYKSTDGETWTEMGHCTVSGPFNKATTGLRLMSAVYSGSTTYTMSIDDASFWENQPDTIVKVRTGGLWAPSRPKFRLGGSWVDGSGKLKLRIGGIWELQGGQSLPVPLVSAGAAETIAPSSTFSRTATEDDSGSPITTRSWEIVSGPLGSGTVIGTGAALTWAPGSSPLATVDIRQPVCQEMAFELNATAENSTTDWTTSYNYIEDIGDDRGYTAGLVGFTSATGDMLVLIQNYANEYPGNALEGYIPGLEQCAAIGYGPDAASAAANYLGAAFMTAWINEADTQPGFRKVQRDMRKSIYWDDCLVQALADEVGPLGLAIHYDILVNHGVGTDSQSYGGIIAAARASSTPPPSAGGDEAAYLTKLCDLRDAVLVDWGDYNPNGRSSMFRSLINGGKLELLGLITWSVYTDPFSFNRPNPPADAQLGDYVLRYSATNAFGTSSSETTVTVDVV
ncbi:chitosanase [Streptomyces phage Madamato]|nr:chitosanase [Streptomyces phage Madamato]